MCMEAKQILDWNMYKWNKFIGDETIGGCHLYLLSIHLKYLCSFSACTTKKKNIIKEILGVGPNGTRQRRKREDDWY